MRPFKDGDHVGNIPCVVVAFGERDAVVKAEQVAEFLFVRQGVTIAFFIRGIRVGFVVRFVEPCFELFFSPFLVFSRGATELVGVRLVLCDDRDIFERSQELFGDGLQRFVDGSFELFFGHAVHVLLLSGSKAIACVALYRFKDAGAVFLPLLAGRRGVPHSC